MDHSVQAYVKRIHIDKLHLLLNSYLTEDKNSISDEVLQDVLEALLSRNAAEGDRLTPYIHKILENQKSDAVQKHNIPR